MHLLRHPDLATLLDTLEPDAELVQRHLWLIALLEWIRGTEGSPQAAVARVNLLLDILASRPPTQERLRLFWSRLLAALDGSTLLADYGFSSRNAFVSEVVQRLYAKCLPASPLTRDAAELFALAMPAALDEHWIAALPASALQGLGKLLTVPCSGARAITHPQLTHWQDTLLDALTFCISQIRSAGFSADIRLRMERDARAGSPFYALNQSLEQLRAAWLDGRCALQAAHDLRVQLLACRDAADTVYDHLDAYGISVDLVFRLRQLRERVQRACALLDCLLDDASLAHSGRLIAHFAQLGQERRSLGALISASSSLLAAKVAQRSSEVGEHYITRNRSEYRDMLAKAGGGGALTALTTALKFLVLATGLSAFWLGFWAGLVYAASFVAIQLLHCTLATKQPAMTAPAMAAKLRHVADSAALSAFVDEVTHLVRSQTAAVIGNVLVVFPTALGLALLVAKVRGAPMLSPATAQHVLDSLSLLGPSAVFAAFTGVLLFASSIIAGWVENWFVLHKLDSALRYNPRITRVLGVQRAHAWSRFLRAHISGLASNISLGFMLGLIPAVLAFMALPVDVRHVTLSAGQLGVACAALGQDVLREPALWWALAAIPAIGLCNVGVSFFLAFRVALRAHDVSDLDRSRIYQAVRQRLRQAPLSFFWPARTIP